MARIELKGLSHSYLRRPREAADYALQPLDLEWKDGGAYALLGPSGCGKTTLLNIISGLVRPSRGKVFFDGRDVTELSPQQRNIAQVFQFPVVYDTMTVAQNLAFPLRNRGLGAEAIRKRVGQVAEMLELSGELDRRARGLTADAKQKISLGRGLVREDVAAVLFDEPLTVIDPHLKWQLRRKLKQIHRELKLTLVYVTHDQVEALTFAERVVVMYEGEIVQIGTPDELFERPDHTFVGYFIGSPGMNVVPVTVEGDSARFGGQQIRLPAPLADGRGGALELGIRPEFVEVGREGMPARIVKVEDIGRQKIVRAEVDGHAIAAVVPEDEEIPAEARLIFRPGAISLYADSRRQRFKGEGRGGAA